MSKTLPTATDPLKMKTGNPYDLNPTTEGKVFLTLEDEANIVENGPGRRSKSAGRQGATNCRGQKACQILKATNLPENIL